MRFRVAATAALGMALPLALVACGKQGASQVEIAVSGDNVKVEGAAAAAPVPAEPPSTPASTPEVQTATTVDEHPATTGPATPAATPSPATPATAPPPAPPAAPVKAAPGHIALAYLIGNVDPAKDPTFARIPDKYIGGSRVWGQKDAVEAFTRMAEDALVNGYKLKVVSAFRSFNDQKVIWDDKWTGKTLVERGKLPVTVPDPAKRAVKILEFSAMPGTSRHHWGTDFDLNSLEPRWFNTVDGKRIYDWLNQHAAEYGFCQVYTAKGPDRPGGYEEEKWHWSYMPVASWYLKQYPVDVGYERLTGFEGSDKAKDINVIEKYVKGINPECQ